MVRYVFTVLYHHIYSYIQINFVNYNFFVFFKQLITFWIRNTQIHYNIYVWDWIIFESFSCCEAYILYVRRLVLFIILFLQLFLAILYLYRVVELFVHTHAYIYMYSSNPEIVKLNLMILIMVKTNSSVGEYFILFKIIDAGIGDFSALVTHKKTGGIIVYVEWSEIFTCIFRMGKKG